MRLGLSLIEGADGRHWEVPPALGHDTPRRPLHEYRIAWTDGFGGVPVSSRALRSRWTDVAYGAAGDMIGGLQNPPGYD